MYPRFGDGFYLYSRLSGAQISCTIAQTPIRFRYVLLRGIGNQEVAEVKSRANKKLRMGLAGLGAASTQILRALDHYPNIVVTAACDNRAEALAAFQRLRSGAIFSSVAEMAQSDDVDAIYVATPNYLHCEHVLEAIDNRKDVIVEKPIAISLDECDRMISAAKRSGVRILAGHTHSFDAPIRAMVDAIRNGMIGDLYMLQNS